MIFGPIGPTFGMQAYRFTSFYTIDYLLTETWLYLNLFLGHVHLFAAGGQNAHFNQYSVPVEFADPVSILTKY